jgi:phage tail sheath protein FI
MPFQLSPGVNVTEIDLTTIIPAVATTDAAFVGTFQWGPVDEITLINNQETLVSTFGLPNVNTADYWFTASNFLDYGNKLHLVRVVEDSLTTGGANTACESPQAATRLLIKNDDDYAQQDENDFDASFLKWAAAYPGQYGNNLRISICDSAPGQFANIATGETANIIASSADIYVGDNARTTAGNTGFNIGDTVYFTTADSGQVGTTPSGTYEIVAFPEGLGPAGEGAGKYGSVKATLNKVVPIAANNTVINRKWEFYDNFDQAPGTSTYAAARGSANDEIHVVVADSSGQITGVKGQVLEKYPNLSKATDAKGDDGSTLYYKDVINTQSKYIRWLNHTATAVSVSVGEGVTALDRIWGNTAFVAGVTDDIVESFEAIKGDDSRTAATPRLFLPDVKTLKGGNNGISTTPAAFMLGYDKFNDPEETDISIVLGGPHVGTTSQYIIENVAEKRKDAVAFISPRKADVVGTSTLSEKCTDVKDYRLTETEDDGIAGISSSYGVMDSGWKYQYDKFNDTYRWVPLNADIAGLCVRTDNTRDPWWSPAGFNRGAVKNVVKLAWNPQKAHRDELYKNGINPVVTFPGLGTVLFGDKTLQTKPSAFDRINVRRLFIVLEKAIATAAKFTLFEFNDEFTRSQFKNMVEPFLRDVQGRRGIYDFRVVCDETNNTGEVIDRNEFVGDIYIKPARSINFIQLNFIAVRTGVDFEEVVGKF